MTLATAGPMLARSVSDLPVDGYVYEPKWDGFRCLAAREADDIELRSRHNRSLTRYFPEVADALRLLDVRRIVLDGELLAGPSGTFSFPALLARLHPAASRVERRAIEEKAAADLVFSGFAATVLSSKGTPPATATTGLRSNKIAPRAKTQRNPMITGHFKTSSRPGTC